MTGSPQNIADLYSTDGTHARNTTNISIFKHLVPYIPIANSSDSSLFKTGISWDASQGGPQFNTSLNQDVVFVTEINGSASRDYEIRVPDKLDTYKGGSGVVEFWVELE